MLEGVEGVDFVICQLCLREGKSGRYKSIVGAHLKKHNMSLEEYKKKFPNQQLEASCVRKKARQTYSQRTPETKNLINQKRKETCKKVYGCSNVSQLAGIKEQKKQTCLEHLGVENPSQSPEIQEKKKQTCLEHLGVEYPMQSEEIQEKFKQTNLKNLGVEYPSQSAEIRAKQRQTCFEHLGVEYPMQSPAIREKTRQTNLSLYGAEYVLQLAEFREKVRRTTRKRLGVDNAMQSPVIQEKARQTNLKNRDVEYPMQSNEVQRKSRQTCLKNHSVKNPSQSPKIKEKKKQTNLKNRGVEHPMQSEKIREKQRQTCWLNLGVSNPSQSPEVQKKKQETNALKSEIFSYIGRNGDKRYLHMMSKPESDFNKDTPDNIMYTGDQVFYVQTPDHSGSKSANPDFLVMPINVTKKVIEIFGKRFHSDLPGISREEAEQDKLIQYAQVGYQCLIIWDDYLKDEPKREFQRAQDFCGAYWNCPFKEDIVSLKKVNASRTRHNQIILENIIKLLARTELTKELEKKKIKMCKQVVKVFSLKLIIKEDQ